MVMHRTLVGLDGVSATRRVVADPDLSHVRVLIVTGRDDDALHLLRCGASGLLINETDPADLLSAVRALGRGGAQLSPSLTRRVIEEFASLPDPELPSPEQFEELTARERDIVALVAAGLTNREIAERLVISSATAKTHVSRAMVKLGAHHRAGLVALAYQTGFAQPLRLTVGGDGAASSPTPKRRPSPSCSETRAPTRWETHT
jgi:DNA-binding NarL/FixJ family response regulator